MIRSIAFLVAVLAAGSATTAAAQPAPWQPERFTAGWVFTPSLVLGTLRDTNVTMLNEGSEFLREWVTLVSPRGELDFNGRRTRFNAGYSGSFEAYRKSDELNRYEQQGRADFRQRLSPRAEVSTHAGLSLTPTTDRLPLRTGAVPFAEVGARLLDTSVGVEINLSARTRFSGGYGFQHVRFDESEFDDAAAVSPAALLGGRTHTPSAALSRELTSRLSVGGSWNYSYGSNQGGSETFGIHQLGGSVTYRISSATTLAANLGAGHLGVPERDLSLWGPVVGGRFEHQRGVVTISARYERSFIPSYTFGGVSSDQTVAGDVRIGFARGRGYVLGGLSYARTEAVEELLLGATFDSTWVRGALGYQVAPWLRAEGFYAGTHQNTSISGNFDRVRVGVQFVTSKPVRIQ